MLLPFVTVLYCEGTVLLFACLGTAGDCWEDFICTARKSNLQISSPQCSCWNDYIRREKQIISPWSSSWSFKKKNLTNNLAEQEHRLSPACHFIRRAHLSEKNKTVVWKVISPEKVSLQSKHTGFQSTGTELISLSIHCLTVYFWQRCSDGFGRWCPISE